MMQIGILGGQQDRGRAFSGRPEHVDDQSLCLNACTGDDGACAYAYVTVQECPLPMDVVCLMMPRI